MRRPGDDSRPAGTRREPRDALPAGTVLGGGYRVERTLGQGGFGIVYLATDLALQRPLAIKEYLPVQLAGRGEGASIGLREAGHKEAFLRGLQSFLREARLLAQFDHPALVRVYRFWEENHTAYMAMPYCEGPTLQASRQTMLRPPDEAWLRDRLLLPLLGALQTLHAGQCLHRDVSPGNILLKPDGQPVLLDFGSARRVVGDMTQPLTAIVNPSYAAIEQYAESPNLPQGPWTDLYALAAVAYFALSGRAPVPATVRAVNDASLMPVSEVAREVERSFPGLHYSAPFLAAIDAALAVRPGDRPQTVAALRDALLRPHVQPDVTVEGPPLQAVPRKPLDRDLAASAPVTAASADAPASQEPEDKAVRAAIDAALADIGDWPPMSRRPPARVDPLLAPEVPPRDESGSAKPPLKVVPGREPPAEPKPLPYDELGISTAPPRAPAMPGNGAWMATAPAIAPMNVQRPAAEPPGASTAADTAPPATEPPQHAPEPALTAAIDLGSAGGLGREPDVDIDHLGAFTDPPPPARRRRSALPWAMAGAVVGLVAAGTWYLQSYRDEALVAGGPVATLPAPTVPQATERSARPGAMPITPTAPTTPAAPAATDAAAAALPASAVVALPAPVTTASAPVVAAAPREHVAATSSSGTSSIEENATRSASARKSANAAAEAPPPRRTAAARPAVASTPRAACGARTNFSLYYCMKTQCRQARFYSHPQCQRLRESDEVS